MLVSHFLFCSEFCLHVKLKPSGFKATGFCRNQSRPLPAACRCWSVQQLWWDVQCCVLVSKVSVMLEKNHRLGDTHSQPGSLGPCTCKVDRQVLCTWSQLERMLPNVTKDRGSTTVRQVKRLLYPHTLTIFQGHLNLKYPLNMVGYRWSNRTFFLL